MEFILCNGRVLLCGTVKLIIKNDVSRILLQNSSVGIEYTPSCNNDVTIAFIWSQYLNAKTFSQPVEICPS